MKRKRYTKEFKAEAVKLVTAHDYSQVEAAQSLGIKAKNLNRWISQAKDESNGMIPKNKLTVEQEELQQLRKENKRLKLEREILKKAAAFFASESA